MPTDANGVYSLPSGYLAADGTTIRASQHNPALEDLASAMTARLPRNGGAAMTGPLKLADGTSTAPSLTLSSTPTAGFYKSGSSLAGINVLGLLPAGVMADYGGVTAPTGWLLCAGQSVLRTDYAALFSAIGISFGAVDSTHFSMPDCRCVVTVGKSDMGGSDRGLLTGATVLGAQLGAENVTLDLTQIPNHFHTVNFNSGTDSPDHTHLVNDAISKVGTFTGGGSNGWAGNASVVSAGASARHTHVVNGNTDGKGGSLSHSNVQPSIVINKIIYAGV